MESKQETLKKVKDRDVILQDVMDNISIQSYMCNYNSLHAYAKLSLIQEISEAYRIECNKQEATDELYTEEEIRQAYARGNEGSTFLLKDMTPLH